MPYTPFDQTKPADSGNGTVTLQAIRDNLMAVRDMAVLGAGFGWNYAGSGGTDDQPAQELFSKGTERLKAALTWGTTGGAANQITVSVFSYSADSGSTYVTIGTETRTYNTVGRVSSTAWS